MYEEIVFASNLCCRYSQYHQKVLTQSKMKDLEEREDRLKVTIKTLMGKMDNLSTKMISRYYVPSNKGNDVKMSTKRALFSSR